MSKSLLQRYVGVISGLVLAVLMTLFAFTVSIDQEQHKRVVSTLHMFRQHNADLSRDMLLLRHGMLTHYDTLEATLTTMNGYVSRLKPDNSDTTEYDALLAAHKNLLAGMVHKVIVVDQFKSDSALFRNSLAYLPIATENLINQLNGDISYKKQQDTHLELIHISQKLIRYLLVFSQTEARHQSDSVTQLILQMEQHKARVAVPIQQMINNLMDHARIVIQYKSRIEGHLFSVINSSTDQQAANYFQTFNTWFENRLAWVNLFRQLLFVFGMMLFVYVMVMIYRLRRKSHQLEQTHEALREEMVQRQRADDQLRKLGLAVEQSPVSVVITDTMGTIDYVNPKFVQATGFTRDEAIGCNPRILKSGDMSSHFYRDLWDTLASGNIWRGEFHNRRKDGSLYWESATISPVKADSGETSHYVAVKEDITQRKQMEAELKQTLASLDEKVALRTQELNEKVAELERTRHVLIENEKMASLGRLVAGFSHEINTPIGVAVGSASHNLEAVQEVITMLENDRFDEGRFVTLLESMDETAKLTLANLRRAANMVHGFKRTSLDQSEEKQRVFSVRDTIDDVIRSFQHAFKNTGIEIKLICDAELRVESYPGCLDQVIGILLSNSRTHAFDDDTQAGIISIEVTGEHRQLSVVFKDNGIGMDELVLSKLFEPFFTTRRGAGNSGLGLYICYNLITSKLAGSVTCSSQHGQGAIFTISFPVVNA
ncbi:MAG: PAS domain S-box protein [Magnetococcales bacterium]|nr:PAS domain S-box protein [Magnetococcales bacterium]